MENVELDMDLASLPKQASRPTWRLLVCASTHQPNQKSDNHFNPFSTDVILATSPKIGTTWLNSILYSILNRSSKHKLAFEHPQELVPFLEGPVLTHSNELSFSTALSDTCQLFRTPISYQLLAKTLDSCECRVVYVARNPKDTLVSLWHFMNKRGDIDHGPSMRLPMLSATASPPYYDHVIGYRALCLKRPENVMFVTYEDMKEDPHGHVKKLADFLGCPFDAEEEVDEIVKNVALRY